MKKKTIYETPLLMEETVSTEYGFAGSGFGAANEAGDTVSEDSKYSYEL